MWFFSIDFLTVFLKDNTQKIALKWICQEKKSKKTLYQMNVSLKINLWINKKKESCKNKLFFHICKDFEVNLVMKQNKHFCSIAWGGGMNGNSSILEYIKLVLEKNSYS